MDSKEFWKILAQHQDLKWYIEGKALRVKKGPRSVFCPITLVCDTKLGEFFHTYEVTKARNLLQLDQNWANRIIYVGDLFGEFVRRRYYVETSGAADTWGVYKIVDQFIEHTGFKG